MIFTSLGISYCQSDENIKQKISKERRDSLEAVFNSEPPYFIVSLELNHDKGQLPTTAKFFVTTGFATIEPNARKDDRFEFAELPDSVQFALAFDSVRLATGFIEKKEFKNGARIVFGYYTNILELETKWNKGKNNDDFNQWTDRPYISAISNKKIIREAKRGRIDHIEFILFSPRVFGHGEITTFQSVKLK